MKKTCLYCEAPLAIGDRIRHKNGRTERLHAKVCYGAYYHERKAASRARLRGEPDAEPRIRDVPGRIPTQSLCGVAACGRKHYGKGLCRAHWTRDRYGNGDLESPILERLPRTRR